MIIISSLSFAQNNALTENYGLKPMDDSENPTTNLRRLISSDNPDHVVYTYDFTGLNRPETGNDYAFNLIPKVTIGEAWEASDAHPSVYQAHYFTVEVLAVLKDLGFDFNEVHVAANHNGANAWSIEGDLNVCYIALGKLSGGSSPSFAEIDVIAHELGHFIMDQTEIPNESDKFEGAVHEGFSDIIGIYSEGQISVNGPPSLTYVMGDDVPIAQVRDMSLPFCWNSDAGNSHISGRGVGHWYYLMTHGGLGVVPMDHEFVINILYETLEDLDVMQRTVLRDLNLEKAEDLYGKCSREYRSMLNAWNTVLCHPSDQLPKDCNCNAGEEVLVADATIDIAQGEVFKFDGNLTVPNGRTLTIRASNSNAQALFPPGTGITVQSGGHLVVEKLTMDCCDPAKKWRGIILEDGASFEATVPVIRNAFSGITIGNLTPENLIMIVPVIEDCGIGIYINGNENIQLVKSNPDPLKYSYEIIRCNTGVKAINSQGLISDVRINDAQTGFDIAGCDDIAILYNEINAHRRGVNAYESTVHIDENNIGLGQDVAIPMVGIRTLVCDVTIDDNVMEASRRGIENSFSIGNGQVSDNIITVHGSTGASVQGIRSWFSDGMHIKQNLVQGSNHVVGIQVKDCVGANVDRNTVDADDIGNGIAVTSGEVNTIQLNEILNSPNNGIGIYTSSGNFIDDNDIEAKNIGLLVDHQTSEDQRITCNNFCSGVWDLSINSAVGRQPHHNNLFRPTGSKAKASGINNNIDQYTFDYQPDQFEGTNCGEFTLKPADGGGIFNPDNGTSSESCDADAGSGLGAMTPEVFCEKLQEATRDWSRFHARLRQLLGRYYATHGPTQLPDCILDCYPTELIRYESELRQAMRADGSVSQNTEGRPSESGVTQLKIVAERQYNLLGGNSSVIYPTIEPCPQEVEDVEVYTETYKRLVKQLAFNDLDETDLVAVRGVASLCMSDHGEVVSWARGLLDLYDVHDYQIQDCNIEIEERNRTITAHTLSLSPNPADHYLEVNMERESINGILIVADITGRQLLRYDLISSDNIRLNTTSLENGYYLISHISDGKVTCTHPFVVQH